LTAAVTASSYPAESTLPPLNSIPIEYYIEKGLIPNKISAKPNKYHKNLLWILEEYAISLNAPGNYAIDLTDMGSIENDGVILKNTGTVDIVNPWLIVNDKRDWYDADTMLTGILKSETDPKKRAFLIWQFLKLNRYHWYPAENANEVHSPTKFINVYGYGFCDDSAVNSECLFKRAGFSGARTWALSGHVVPEVYYDSAWHMLDPDLQVFYPKSDNMHIAGVEDCALNGWLVERVSGSGIESLYTSTSNNSTFQNSWSLSHTMSMTLRPGEQIERYWYNWGKYHDFCYIEEPPQYGNGRVKYEPDLDSTIFKNGFQTIQNIECFADSLTTPKIHLSDPEQNGILICKIASPYVFVGGSVVMNFYCKGITDNITLQFSKNGSTWYTLHTLAGPFSGIAELNLDDAIAPVSSYACYSFWIRLTLTGEEKESAGIDHIIFSGDIQCAPNALPTLEPAIVNSANVRFTSQPGASLKITHIYQKVSSIYPPESPGGDIYPINNDIIDTTAPTLSWDEAPTSGVITQHEIMVSWDPYGILPVTPLTWKIINSATSWTVPEDWLLEGQTYYWNVRAKDDLGNWSPWGGPWKFTIDNPVSRIHQWKQYNNILHEKSKGD
jgi:hypothetical protein